ncbi:hypothetical protein [Streptomyces sp. KR55]|uniref:hypothetical protein n=1 Tax=Streptomyces sp. KR55 TaxID=3457425 RepID=UPI003FD288D9
MRHREGESLAPAGTAQHRTGARSGGAPDLAEQATVALSRRGVRASVIRLAPTVHSSLDNQGFVPALIGIARRTGVSAYLAEGANRWPAARLYRLAAPAGREAGAY